MNVYKRGWGKAVQYPIMCVETAWAALVLMLGGSIVIHCIPRPLRYGMTAKYDLTIHSPAGTLVSVAK